MKKSNLILIAALLSGNTVMAADSVYEWGSWQAEEDIVAAILAGADPAEVTSAPAAGPGAKGTVVQPIIPVALDNISITWEEMPKEFETLSVIGTDVCADARLCQEGIFPGGIVASPVGTVITDPVIQPASTTSGRTTAR